MKGEGRKEGGKSQGWEARKSPKLQNVLGDVLSTGRGRWRGWKRVGEQQKCKWLKVQIMVSGASL